MCFIDGTYDFFFEFSLKKYNMLKVHQVTLYY